MIIHDVEQRSPEWYALRAGIPTASEFSRIVTSKGEPSKSVGAYAMQLAGEVFAGQPLDAWEGNQWTERGRVLEDDALDFYAFTSDAEVSKVGFITDDAKTVGCSPDALADTDGMVEVKCLKADRHIAAILYHQRHGRCQTDYVQQPQGQMWIAERKWCDLIFYHPVLPPLVVRQYRDEAVLAGLRSGIRELLAERDEVLGALRAHAGLSKVSSHTSKIPAAAHLPAAKPSSHLPY